MPGVRSAGSNACATVARNVNNSFWKDRPTFVTGATGLVGGWLVNRLLDAGADVVCLVRDWVPQSELVRSRDIERVKVGPRRRLRSG